MDDVLIAKVFFITSRCHLCFRHEESISHLFVHCYYAKALWSALAALFGFSYTPIESKELYKHVCCMKLSTQLLTLWNVVFMQSFCIFGLLVTSEIFG